MKNPRFLTLGLAVLGLAMVVGAYASAGRFQDDKPNPNCIAPKGCVLYMDPRYRVYLVDTNDQVFEVKSLTIALTEEQARVIKNPNAALKQARSYLVTFSYEGQSCRASEQQVNQYVTDVLVSRYDWEAVQNGTAPVTFCQEGGN